MIGRRKPKALLDKLRARHFEILETQEWLQAIREAQEQGLPQPDLYYPRAISKDDIID